MRLNLRRESNEIAVELESIAMFLGATELIGSASRRFQHESALQQWVDFASQVFKHSADHHEISALDQSDTYACTDIIGHNIPMLLLSHFFLIDSLSSFHPHFSEAYVETFL